MDKKLPKVNVENTIPYRRDGSIKTSLIIAVVMYLLFNVFLVFVMTLVVKSSG